MTATTKAWNYTFNKWVDANKNGQPVRAAMWGAAITATVQVGNRFKLWGAST